MFSRFNKRSEIPTVNEPAHIVVFPEKTAPPKNDMTELKTRFHTQLLDKIDLSVIDKVKSEDLCREVGTIVREMLSSESIALNSSECTQLIEEILDELLGLGPLEPFLKDDTVDDILVNGPHQIYIERSGILELTDGRFKDETHLLRIIDKIVSKVGRRVDESQPWVDARLPDGSRVNAIVPPCALNGPTLSIRKFAKMPYTMERLMDIGAFTPEMAEYMKRVVKTRLNILISGGTGSGKTTFLNALSNYIDNRERIVTIEDPAELQLQQPHVVSLETKAPNIEGKGAVTQCDLVRNALRMRPDRIVVGEVRGPEVLDMLQAMNTGHDGSMTTIHSNSPRDAFSRLEQMIGMAGSTFNERMMRQQTASALHVVVQLSRLSDGKRKVMSIQEIVGMEGDVISMQEIFRFERTGMNDNGDIIGHFTSTGIRSNYAERFTSWGMPASIDMFEPVKKVR